MLNYSIEIVYIKSDYIDYLYKFDSRVMLNKGQTRPYIGALFTINNHKYYAPLTHPKEKFKNMNNSIDFLKLDNGKLGAINFNNMIPVPSSTIIHIKIKELEDIKYKYLLLNQIRFLNKNDVNIIQRATRLYQYHTNKTLKESVYKRCCNFKYLESIAEKYNSK